jgi:hypothetical protein
MEICSKARGENRDRPLAESKQYAHEKVGAQPGFLLLVELKSLDQVVTR